MLTTFAKDSGGPSRRFAVGEICAGFALSEASTESSAGFTGDLVLSGEICSPGDCFCPDSVFLGGRGADVNLNAHI